MKLKGDQSTTGALNRRLVLNALRSEGERSRVEIAGMTGLSQAAMSAVVGELDAEVLSRGARWQEQRRSQVDSAAN